MANPELSTGLIKLRANKEKGEGRGGGGDGAREGTSPVINAKRTKEKFK